MTEMKKINVEELVNAAGGEWRQVNTRTVQNGVLRSPLIRTAHGYQQQADPSTTLTTEEHGMSSALRITAGWLEASLVSMTK